MGQFFTSETNSQTKQILKRNGHVRIYHIRTFIKGNLAHKCMGLYVLCLLFDLDIFNTLEMKNIGNTAQSWSHRGHKIQFENPLNFGFPNDSLCDVSTLGNSFLRKKEFLS